MTIIVAGYIVSGPLGGLVWHHMQYVIALDRMGFNILFVEHSNDYPSCYNPGSHQLTTDPTYGLAFLTSIFDKYQLSQKWAYYDLYTDKWFGKSGSDVKKIAAEAEIFINLSGLHPVDDIFESIPIKIFVDTDPVFTQIRHLTNAAAMELAKRHTHFFTFGENFSLKDCTIPDDGLPWQPTRQPVVNNLWENQIVPDIDARWTTIMQWDSYDTKEYQGRTYGMKSVMFDPYFSIPSRTREKFELAIGGATVPEEKFVHEGWSIKNSVDITLTPEGYQDYIRRSKGEWSVAKQGYVNSNSGWFSERTAAYLASG